MVNCSVGDRFDEPFNIPEGRCQERAFSSHCSVELKFHYGQQYYTMDFGKLGLSYDYFYIASETYLSYTIVYVCSKNTNCPAVYAQNRIHEMVTRDYDAKRMYGELALLIENPSRNGPIQCYDLKNNVITCSSRELCSLEFDTRGKKMKSRGCKLETDSSVYGFDGDRSPSLHVECTQNLCNGDITLTQIKRILAEYGVTDANGRRIATGTKEMASSLSVTLAFIFALVCYL